MMGRAIMHFGSAAIQPILAYPVIVLAWDKEPAGTISVAIAVIYSVLCALERGLKELEKVVMKRDR